MNKNSLKDSQKSAVNELQDESDAEVKLELSSSDKSVAEKTTDKEVSDEVNALKKELEEKDKLVKEYLSRLQYLQADFENYKKRSLKEKENYIKLANELLITQMLDILDNFERAIEFAKQTANKEPITQGIEMIYNQLLNVLKNEGLEVIKTVGEPFDPYKHEAIVLVSSNDYKDNTIIEELQKGYMLYSEVIRPSKVKVVRNIQRGEKSA